MVCKCSEPKKECANMPTPGNPEQKCINFARARPSTEDFDCQFRAKQGINTVTHWLDLSTVRCIIAKRAKSYLIIYLDLWIN